MSDPIDPIKVTVENEIKPGVFINTTAVLTKDKLTVSIRSWTNNLTRGAHSRAVVYLFDDDGNRLWNTPELQCGIGGHLETLIPIFDSTVKSDRTENYNFSVPLDLALQAKYMRIVHSDRAKPFNEYLTILNRFFDAHKQDKEPIVHTDNGDIVYISKSEVIFQGDTMSESTYNLNQSQFGGGFAGTGGTQTGGTLNNYSSNQNLSEAAEEIQKLLKQLELSNPTTTEVDKVTVAAKAAEEIKKNPMLKDRAIAALKLGGTEAFKEAVNHPLVNILVAIIEGWAQAK